MGDTLRRVLCGAPSARKPLVRMDAPAPVAPPPNGPAVRTIDALVARLREMDAEHPRCATPSCPRRPVGSYCPVCVRRSPAVGRAAYLLDAGWTRAKRPTGNAGWRHPTTGAVYPPAKAETIARHESGDAPRDGAP